MVASANIVLVSVLKYKHYNKFKQYASIKMFKYTFHLEKTYLLSITYKTNKTIEFKTGIFLLLL